MIKLGALWKPKESGKDGPVLSGSINDSVRIVIFKNGYKKEPNHPDYILYAQENERKPKASKPVAREVPEEDVSF